MRAENRFDQWIREAMHEASVPLSPEHWSQLQTRLDAADAAEASDTPQPEDNLMREKLENLELPLAVGHWAAFTEILDQELPIETDLDTLDTLIRTRMSDLETPAVAAAAASWSAMSAKLDKAMPTPEAQFDDAVRQRMQKMEAPYNANHWAQMRERLERQRRWRFILMRYKVAEVALMMLLLFTAVNWFVITPTLRERNALKYSAGSGVPATPVVPYASPASPEAVVKDAMPKVLKPRKKSGTPQADAATSLPMATLSPSADGLGNLGAVGGINTSVGTLSAGDAATAMPTSPMPTMSFTSAATPMALADISADNMTESATTKKFEIGEEADKTAVAAVPSSSSPARKTKDVVEVLTSTERAELTDNLSVQEVAVVGLSRKTWHWGSLVSADVDNVTTPYDADRRRKPYEVVGGGVQLGLTADYTKDKTTLVAGVVIGEKRYDTPLQFEFGNFHDGYFVEKLESIRFRIFSIPVAMRYRLAQKGRHTLYAIGGVNFSGILNSKYERVTSRLSNSREEQELPLPDPLPPSPSADMDWPVGLLQGGTSEDNIFSTGTIGIGYEYNMGQKTSFYIQPTYRHYLSAKGLGPKHDTFNSISVQVGTRTAL